MKTDTKTSLFKIFLTFFKIGALTFGGGYAMMAVTQSEVIEKGWATEEEMLDMLVIAESTPGVYAVNTATGVGYRLRGFVGSLVATLGVVLPSFVIICALSFVLDALSGNVWYEAAFAGVKVAAMVLVLNAFISLNKMLQADFFTYLLLFGAFTIVLFTDVSVIWILLTAGVFGSFVTLVPHKDLPLCGVLKEEA